MKDAVISRHDAIIHRWKCAYHQANDRPPLSVAWINGAWYRIEGQQKNIRIGDLEKMAERLEQRDKAAAVGQTKEAKA